MDFEFIRPQLLWLLLLLIPLGISIYMRQHRVNHKQPLIASHLAQFVLTSGTKQQRQSPWLSLLFVTLAIIAAAGPSWEKQAVPIYQAKQARVLVMDMSLSMFSADIKPNRLSQARFKALDMVELFNEGETALVAYAENAFTVSPLTTDAQTLANLIPSLSPDIMPGKGSNVMAGLTTASELLTQAGYLNGDIILVTDGIDSDDLSSVQEFAQGTGYTLSIYAVATEQGAPIELPQGGFLKDRYGQIVVPKAQFASMRGITKRSGGHFSAYTASNADIAIFAKADDHAEIGETDQQHTLSRLDGGVYLMLLLVPLALLLIKQNQLLIGLCALLIVPTEQAYAVEWSSLWKNNDQRALNAYQQGDFKQAQDADSPTLKGAALYQQGQYEDALAQFSQDESAEGLYNQGNALAKLGKLPEAIEKYEQSLARSPNLEKAQKNKALLEQLLQQQQQQQDNQSDQQNQNNEQQNSDQQQQSDQGSAQQSDSNQQQSDQQNSDPSKSDSSDNQQGQQSESDQQNSNAEQQNKPEMSADPQQQAQQGAADEQKNNDSQQEQQQAVAQNEPQTAQEGDEQTQQAAVSGEPLTAEEREKAQQLNQLLRKVPDDPAILLRNKMRLEYQNRGRNTSPQGVKKSW